MSIRMFKTIAGEFVVGTLVDFDNTFGQAPSDVFSDEEKANMLADISLTEVVSFTLESPMILGRSPQGGLGMGPAIPWVKIDDDARVRYSGRSVAFEVDHTQEALHAGLVADYKQATSKIQLVQAANVSAPGVGFPFGRGMPT